MPAPSRAPVSFQRSVTETPLFQSQFWRTPLQCVARRMFGRRPFRFRRQGKMSSRFKVFTGTVAIAALLSLCSPALAQSDDADPEMRIERLENQLRQLTGQNEELQYRNRQLEERLRALEGGAQASPVQTPVQPNVAAMPPAQAAPAYRQQPPHQQAAQPNYEQPQIASPAPIVQEQPAPGAPGTRRRGDAFDPNQSPNAPGAPRALGGGQQPMPAGAPSGAPGGRGAGEPLDLANSGPRYPQAVGPGCAARLSAGLVRLSRAIRRHGPCDPAALGNAARRIRPRNRLHAAQGLCAGRADHEEFLAEISERPAAR